MTADRWELIERLFHSAQTVEARARESWLRRECNGDSALYSEVVSLLEAEPDSDWMSGPPARVAAGVIGRAEPHLNSGYHLGRYTIRNHVSAGGMGEVYLAEDAESGEPVALKVLRGHLKLRPGAIERFNIEARAAAAISHPNLVRVYETGVSEVGPFIAMEWVQGTTWRRLVEEGQACPETAVRLGAQAARALQTAHAAGILHRDIKPENLMLRPDGLVKVLDFGLARLGPRPQLDPDALGSSGTISGTLSGTLHYMAPELLRGEPATAASDIFSLGVVLYELATGSHPFAGDTPLDVFEAIECRVVTPAVVIRSDVPAELDRMLTRMLDRECAARPQAGEVADSLERITSA